MRSTRSNENPSGRIDRHDVEIALTSNVCFIQSLEMDARQFSRPTPDPVPPTPGVSASNAESDSQEETRRRLLNAAGEVFARDGFQGATVREICALAGANVAAINYHFGDKERLYRAVLLDSAARARERFPLDGGHSADAKPDPRDAIRLFVRAFMGKLFDPGRPAWLAKLMSQEMANPTGALHEVAERFMKPDFARLKANVAELLGPEQGNDPERVRLCAASIVAQLLFYHHCRGGIEAIMPEQQFEPPALARIADHIAEFSLAAITTLARHAPDSAPRASGGPAGTARRATPKKPSPGTPAQHTKTRRKTR